MKRSIDDNILAMFYNHCDDVQLPEKYIDMYTEQVESGFISNDDLWSLSFRDKRYLIDNIENSM